MNDQIDPRLLAALGQDPILSRLLGTLSGRGPEPSARMSAAIGGRDPFQLPAVTVQGVPERVDDMILRWRGRGMSNNVEDRRTPTVLSQYGVGKIGSMPERPLPPVFSDSPPGGSDTNLLLQAAGGDDGTGILQHILQRMGLDGATLPVADEDPDPPPTLPAMRVTGSVRQQRGLSAEQFGDDGLSHGTRFNFGQNPVRRNRSGNYVVDSLSRGKDGKVPTHRIDLLPPEVQSGHVSVQDWEQSVLNKAPDQFGPAARATTNSVDALDEEVRSPMQHMMAAARAAGHEVYINETRRPQERQEWLFQQGRSRPGPIVTWTLTSDHRDGRAADLRFGSDAGYRWMWANAGRFGLYTLGPSDAGHVGMQTRPAAPARRQAAAPARRGESIPERKQRNP
jgi:hypothetical protein